MLQIMINGNPVPARDGATILEAAYEDKYARTQFDTEILSLQYLKGVQEKDDSRSSGKRDCQCGNHTDRAGHERHYRFRGCQI